LGISPSMRRKGNKGRKSKKNALGKGSGIRKEKAAQVTRTDARKERGKRRDRGVIHRSVLQTMRRQGKVEAVDGQ